jgi:hypothetical protein
MNVCEYNDDKTLGTTYTCMLNAQGEILAHLVSETRDDGLSSMNSEELAAVISTLRRSVSLFGKFVSSTICFLNDNHVRSWYSEL